MDVPSTNPSKGVNPTDTVNRLRTYLGQDKPATEEPDGGETEAEDIKSNAEVVDEVEEDDQEQPEVPEDESDDDEEDDSGLPPEFFAKKVKATVNGEEVLITVEEAAQGYQRLQDYTRKSQEVAKNRTILTNTIEEYKKGLEVIGQFMASDVEAYKKIDWNALKAEDPGKYAVMKLEYADAQSRFSQLQQTWQQAMQQQGQLTAEQMAEVVQQEGALLVKAIPEWKDSTKQEQLRRTWAKYGSEYGFSQQELEGITDHRMLVVLNKATKYDQLMDKNKSVSDKKIANAPRVVANKKSNDAKTPTEKNYKSVVQNFQERKDIGSAAELLKARWKAQGK